MTTVDIFGTLHVDRPSKVEDELLEFAQQADVLFTEEPRTEPTSEERYQLLFRNPSMALAGRFLAILWGVLGYLVSRKFSPVDRTVTRRVAKYYQIDLEPVDLNLVSEATNVSRVVTVASWIWFGLTALLFLLGAYVLTASILVGGEILIFAVGLSFLPTPVFAYSTLSNRDRGMASNIESIVDASGAIDRGCLVVGNGHMERIIDEIKQSDIELGAVHESKFFRPNSHSDHGS